MEKTNYKWSPASIDGRDLGDDWIYSDFPFGTELKKGSFHRYAFYYNERLWEALWEFGGNLVTFRYADDEQDEGNIRDLQHYEDTLFSSCEIQDTDTNEPRLTHRSSRYLNELYFTFWWEG